MQELDRRASALGLPQIPSPPSHENQYWLDQGSEETDPNTQTRTSRNYELDPSMDPRRLRRLMASRRYSERYRFKQLQYTVQLENEVKSLQVRNAMNYPRLKHVDRKFSLLRTENGSMKKKLADCSDELRFKEAQYVELKKELDMWKQRYVMYQRQQQPDLTEPNLGNHQMMNNTGFNDQFNQYMEPEVGPQMVNNNLNQFGPPTWDMNSHCSMESDNFNSM